MRIALAFCLFRKWKYSEFYQQSKYEEVKRCSPSVPIHGLLSVPIRSGYNTSLFAPWGWRYMAIHRMTPYVQHLGILSWRRGHRKGCSRSRYPIWCRCSPGMYSFADVFSFSTTHIYPQTHWWTRLTTSPAAETSTSLTSAWLELEKLFNSHGKHGLEWGKGSDYALCLDIRRGGGGGLTSPFVWHSLYFIA